MLAVYCIRSQTLAVLAVYSVRPGFLAVPPRECQDFVAYGLNGQDNTYTTGGSKRDEADAAVVLPGKAEYLIRFVSPGGQWDAHTDAYDVVFSTLKITGP